MKNLFILIIIISHIFSYEIYKEIKIENVNDQLASNLQLLNIDIDHVHMNDDNSIKFAISETDLQKIQTHNIPYTIIHENLEEFYASRLTNDFESRDFELGSMGGYYTLDEIVQNLDELYQDYPNLVAEKISIGQSLEGRDIWALKMSDNPNIDEDEAEVLYTGLHHAREPMSYMNLFYYMNWLVENYETDQMAKDILDNRELWFVPAINPDGLIYNQQIAPNGGGMQRKNGRETCNGGVDGVDLNRNYSFMWGLDNQGSSPDGCDETYRGNGPFSEPETAAIEAFIEAHDFPVAFNYHSYSNLLLHPFGYTEPNPMDEEDIQTFTEIGEELVSVNGYLLGTGVDILYAVNGEACDWMYGEHGIFAYTPEVGSSQDGFWPATNRIIPLCEENLYANQYLALVAGSNYSSDISLQNETFVQGQSYPLNISVKNTGLSDSSGDVQIDVISSENLLFELSEINIGDLDAGENIDLGNITFFEVSQSAPEGTVEEIIVNVYDGYNVISSNSISILIGEPEVILNEEFELPSSWVVGSADDDATAGIWERAIPNPTYDDNGEIIQPDFDHTENGQFCFITGNSVSQNDSEFGFDDVDGGKTTLVSPQFDLSEYSTAAISYWRWYSNSAAGGANPGNDIWRVDGSNDGGNSWTNLELTSQDSNEWTKHQFILNDETISLTNQMKFRFIAEDVFNEGDNGSGGSIIEAALDDFQILVFNDNLAGDVNYDGDLNVQDVVIMINMILGNIETDIIADINNDGGINIQDVVLLINSILR
tara:strand:- start:5706 stop:8012 length:2307 start_codon:yes stop_codon:yes gene_type:complete